MISLLLLSFDLALMWFLCLTFLLSVEGWMSPTIPLILFAIILVLSISLVVRELKEKKNHKYEGRHFE